MAQYVRSIEDVSKGYWTDGGSIEVDTILWNSIDEVTSDNDVSYITNSKGSGDTAKIRLSGGNDPQSSINHILHVLFRSIGSGAGEKLDVKLYCATTLICSRVNLSNRTDSYVDIAYTLSTSEADAIANYTDLYLEIIANTVGSTEELRVTQAYLEFPDAGPTEYVYNGNLTLGMVPTTPKGIIDAVYTGSLTSSIVPDASKAILDMSYIGGLDVSLTPNAFSILTFEYTYNGDLTLSLTPNSTSFLDRSYISTLGFSLLPSVGKALLEKSYNGNLLLVMFPNAECFLEGATGEYLYIGNLLLNILPNSSKGILDTSYTGNLMCSLSLLSTYSLKEPSSSGGGTFPTLLEIANLWKSYD